MNIARNKDRSGGHQVDHYQKLYLVCDIPPFPPNTIRYRLLDIGTVTTDADVKTDDDVEGEDLKANFFRFRISIIPKRCRIF